MKTDKEYPATHSMDTTWFAVDESGEVAILQIEEEGPGPEPKTDIHSYELIWYLGESDHHGTAILQFTEEQINELTSELKEPDVKTISNSCNILLAPNQIEKLRKHGAQFDLCYSKSNNFYHLNWWKCKNDNELDAYLQSLIDDGIVLKACQCDIEIYFRDWREDQSEHRLAHFPFYVYEQSYDQSRAAERVVIPKHAFREEQLPETVKKEYVIHLPVKFSELKTLQPAEFVDCSCWYERNHTKVVNGVTYMQVPLSHGGYGYVKLITGDKPHNWSDLPRVIDLSDEYIEPND